MIYNINISGQFRNIETINAVPAYPVSIRCSNCKWEYEKYILLSHNDKPASIPKKPQHSNIRVCKQCSNPIHIALEPPQMIKKSVYDTQNNKIITKYINSNKEDNLRQIFIGRIIGVGFEIINIPRVEISVISLKGMYYEDIALEEGSWSASNKDDPNVFIDCFNIEIIPCEEKEHIN